MSNSQQNATVPRNTPLPNIVALFAAGAGLVTMVFVGEFILANLAAQRWPTTQGTVIESHVASVLVGGSQPGTHRVDRAQVRFRYDVAGKSFESENVKFSTSQMGGDYGLYPPELVAQYPVGAVIPVVYDPANPAKAVSDVSLDPLAWAKLMAGFLAFAGGVYYLAAVRSMAAPSQPGAVDDPGRTPTFSRVMVCRWHPGKPRERYALSGLLALGSLWSAYQAAHAEWNWLLQGIAAVFAVGALAMHANQWTRIDLDAGTVSRNISLFGRLPLRHSVWPLSDFVAVDVARLSSGGTPNALAVYQVGLRGQTGRRIQVRYFAAPHGFPCVPATDFARTLAKFTGLQLAGE